MEYCDLSLDNWLVERNQINDIPSTETYKQCISISKQLISAMAFIHDNNIIHLDFRPANIFVKKGETLQVKIGDFGLSVSPSSRQNAISPNNMGSYYYLSPESEISEKKDIFAIGVTLYEVFTKFTTAAERHYVLKSIKEECSLPSFDKSFYLFWQISKMVSRDPLDRPDLHEILDSYSLEDGKAATESLIVEGSPESAVELQRLRTRVKMLESVLLENGIKCP
ncbi:MAG: Eukaryotic translation initiation factor 2-alpha kinase [Marteilia pararefringens]